MISDNSSQVPGRSQTLNSTISTRGKRRARQQASRAQANTPGVGAAPTRKRRRTGFYPPSKPVAPMRHPSLIPETRPAAAKRWREVKGVIHVDFDEDVKEFEMVVD